MRKHLSGRSHKQKTIIGSVMRRSVYAMLLLLAAPAINTVLSPSAHAATPSGVVYQSLREGKGASPTADDVVRVHYRGTLFNGGKEFDSSYARGEPIELLLRSVIPCWTEGVPKMKPGGKARLICSPETAYGEQGAGPIPPNATLAFDIELIEIKGQPETSPAMQEEIAAYAQAERNQQEMEAEKIRKKRELAAQEARDAQSRETKKSVASLLGGLAKIGEAYIDYEKKRSAQAGAGPGLQLDGVAYEVVETAGITEYWFPNVNGCITAAPTGRSYGGGGKYREYKASNGCAFEVTFSYKLYYNKPGVYAGTALELFDKKPIDYGTFTGEPMFNAPHIAACLSRAAMETRLGVKLDGVDVIKKGVGDDPGTSRFVRCKGYKWKPHGTAL